jgi:hypothetical protein
MAEIDGTRRIDVAACLPALLVCLSSDIARDRIRRSADRIMRYEEFADWGRLVARLANGARPGMVVVGLRDRTGLPTVGRISALRFHQPSVCIAVAAEPENVDDRLLVAAVRAGVDELILVRFESGESIRQLLTLALTSLPGRRSRTRVPPPGRQRSGPSAPCPRPWRVAAQAGGDEASSFNAFSWRGGDGTATYPSASDARRRAWRSCTASTGHGGGAACGVRLSHVLPR